MVLRALLELEQQYSKGKKQQLGEESNINSLMAFLKVFETKMKPAKELKPWGLDSTGVTFCLELGKFCKDVKSGRCHNDSLQIPTHAATSEGFGRFGRGSVQSPEPSYSLSSIKCNISVFVKFRMENLKDKVSLEYYSTK